MIDHLYRYRPIEAVLEKFNELERQEIYFSTPGELNDPMEGFKDLFWSGDRIVWENFLKHYILCLQEMAIHVFVAGSDFDNHVLDKIVFYVPDSLPDAPIRTIYKRLSEAFLGDAAAKTFLNVVSSRSAPIRRNELTSYLRALHPLALGKIFKEFVDHGVLPSTSFINGPTPEKLRQDAKNMMEGIARLPKAEFPPERLSEALFAANESIVSQMDLIFEYNLPDRSNRGMAFVTRYFPAAYVRALEKLVHRDWYVACFSASATNPSMWGSYGQGHRGVCLKFKTPPNIGGGPTFTIKQVNAVSASPTHREYISSYIQHPLHKLAYSQDYPAIDFFRSLGSMGEMYMNNFWYRDADGIFSSCRNAVYDDNAAWRDQYWKTFTASALCKTPEWSHEEEYRMLIHSGFDMREKDKRKLKYKFEDLAGIIFGVRTDMEDKLKIMRIIDKQCAETHRSDFEFFEVTYAATESKFIQSPLGLIKIKHNYRLQAWQTSQNRVFS